MDISNSKIPVRQSDAIMKILGLAGKAMSILFGSRFGTSGPVTQQECGATPIVGVDPGGGNERQHKRISASRQLKIYK